MGMLRCLAAVAALLSFLVCSGQANAQITIARDHVPAATLLFPYFEVDLDDPQGSTTILQVRNASASAVLANYTVYTDFGIPVISFQAYLTGYDIVTFDVRAMLEQGILPRTASAGQDPADTISNKGWLSQDINFASCTGTLPYPTPVLVPTTIADMQAQLTGRTSPLFGQCSGFDHGDNVARGYVTVDTVNQCTGARPNDPGYFVAGGGGIATNQNILTGEYTLLGPNSRLLHSAPAAAIEASAVQYVLDESTPDPDDYTSIMNPETAVPGEYTFYGRHVAFTASDNREPLPATWAIDTQAHKGELIVWRDPKTAHGRFSCSLDGPPAFYPLGQESTIQFDRQAQVQSPAAVNPFPLVTQRVALGSAAFPAQVKPGWTYLGLNTTIAGSPNPPEDPASAQSYVTVIQYPELSDIGGGTGVALPLDVAGSTSVHVHPAQITP